MKAAGTEDQSATLFRAENRSTGTVATRDGAPAQSDPGRSLHSGNTASKGQRPNVRWSEAPWFFDAPAFWAGNTSQLAAAL
jgi:hypothetical protein